VDGAGTFKNSIQQADNENVADKLIVLVNRTMWVAVIGAIVGAATSTYWGGGRKHPA
jgi:hypothetical protein